MDTTPPDREFCARGEQLYVEAQLDLACWRRSYPQIEHLKAAVADRELAVDSNSPLGLRVAIAQGMSSSYYAPKERLKWLRALVVIGRGVPR